MVRIAVAFAVATLLVACSDDEESTGPQFPNLRGNYESSWDFSFTLVSSGQTFSVDCDGSVNVASQSGDSFSGSFIIRESDDCELVSGSLAGEVRSDGGLNFTIDVPGADPNELAVLTGCAFVSGDNQFNGIYAGGRLSASAGAVLICAIEGSPQRVNFDVEIEAVKLATD